MLHCTVSRRLPPPLLLRASAVAGITALLTLAALTAAAPPAAAQLTFFETNGADAAAITSTRDDFRAAIGGGIVAGANGSFGGVRREINWDGVPDSFSDPNPFPGNFFNVNSPRGAVFTTPGTGFLVSADSSNPTSTPVRFGFPADFVPFSEERLFSPIGSTITDVFFFVPGTGAPATTTAFGAIFSDVEVAGSSSIQFFDVNGTLLGSRDALTGPSGGLSFLGAQVTGGAPIARVRITSGTATLLSNGVLDTNTGPDAVVLDDFIYAEPNAVAAPEAGTLALTMLPVAFGTVCRRRRRQ